MKYLTNSISLNMFELNSPRGLGLFLKPLNLSEFCAEVKNSINAIGHKATTDLINTLCSTDLVPNRIEIKLSDKDELIIIQIMTRLPEGKILSTEEINNLYNNGLIRLLKVKVRIAPLDGKAIAFTNNVDMSTTIEREKVSVTYYGEFTSEALVFDIR
ncbi:MAG: DUF1874 domain-containing protein [Desulfurococcaceae archaeon]